MLNHILPITVNTLLNGLEAITYGPLLIHSNVSIFFPTNAGICMYLLSTVTAQIVLSMMSSFPYGVTACPIIESVPFLYLIGNSIKDGIGKGYDLRTTIMLAYSLLAFTTSIGFVGLWAMGLEKAIHQIPRTVLLGTMGGVGIFLLRSALRFVSLLEIYVAGLSLAVMSVVLERKLRLFFFIPISCLVLFACFYGVALVSGIELTNLRQYGWLPQANTVINPLSVYSGLSIGSIDFRVVASTIPIIVVGTMFNMINIPINVPSLARFTGLTFRIKSELLAHAACNVATSIVGCLPTYMAYTNSILFIKSGSIRKTTGVLLGLATIVLMILFGKILPFVPTLLTVYLSCNLGLDLMTEAIIVPFTLCRSIEYGVIIVTMTMVGFYGFTSGLAFGLLLASATAGLDKRRHRRVEGRGVVEFTTIETIEKMVLRQTLLARIHTVKFSGQLYFGNLIRVMDSLSFCSTDCLFQIIDFTQMTTCDLNVIEGLCGYINRRRGSIEVVLVNHELLSQNTQAPNYPSHMHATVHCERLFHSKIEPEQQQKLTSLIQLAKDMEQQLKTSCSFEQICGQSGSQLNIEDVIIFLESGSARLTDSIFVEPGAWLLPGQVVTFITECSVLIYNVHHVNKTAVDFIANLYNKETLL